LIRCSTEATQAIDELESSIAENMGLDSVLENGDLPKICADVSHDVYTDLATGKAGLADICSDIVTDVLSGIACPDL